MACSFCCAPSHAVRLLSAQPPQGAEMIATWLDPELEGRACPDRYFGESGSLNFIADSIRWLSGGGESSLRKPPPIADFYAFRHIRDATLPMPRKCVPRPVFAWRNCASDQALAFSTARSERSA